MSADWSSTNPAAASSPGSPVAHAATFQNRSGSWTPRYTGSSAPSTGAVNTDTRRSFASEYCRTWSSSPSHSSLDWLKSAAWGAAFV